jgi:hypothetical protein
MLVWRKSLICPPLCLFLFKLTFQLTQAYKNSTGVGRSGKVNRWKQIGANSYIVDVIENGYKIPFLHIRHFLSRKRK